MRRAFVLLCAVPYRNDPNLNSPSGLIESINFPSCYNGQASYPSPNGDGPGGDADVPGYFDPSLGSMSDDNDFSYVANGTSTPCNGEDIVPRLTMRIHYVGLWTISDDSKTVYARPGRGTPSTRTTGRPGSRA
jgi:hypothetical protein